MLDQTIGSWLDELASESSTPGGGAAAAMNAAVAAGLVAMVCNLTIGRPRYAEHEQLMQDTLAASTRSRAEAIQLAADDAEAFRAVTDAYKLPSGTDAEKSARTGAIQAALVGAADAPMRTAALAVAIIDLAAAILDGANVNVVSDVAVAASSARSALESAAVNVEINLAMLHDQARRDALRAELDRLLPAVDTAAGLVATVRERIDR